MDRLKAFIATTPYRDYALSVASADASFRAYYRLSSGDKSVIVMDSSLELNSLSPFIDVTSRLLNVKVKVPQILESDTSQGYLILEDFGDTKLLDILNSSNFKHHYLNAIDEIIKMQEAKRASLPIYDRAFLHFEMDLMREWYLEKKLALTLSAPQKKLIEESLTPSLM